MNSRLILKLSLALPILLLGTLELAAEETRAGDPSSIVGGGALLERSEKGFDEISNRATIIQRHGGGNIAIIRQAGVHNVARQTQSGTRNTALVEQQGVSNSIVQSQLGDSNLAGSLQEGDRNKVTQTQKGRRHKHTVVTIGSGVTLSVLQHDEEYDEE